MSFDYEKAKQEFIAELEAGEFDAEILPNNEKEYYKSEAMDLAAFEEYMESADFKSFVKKALG